jgi:WD40 repeat protein
VRVWDAETGALQQTLAGHIDPVSSVAFSHDGRRLASGSDDETFHVWDAETGALQQTLEIGSSLAELSFGPDDSYLITELGFISLSQSPLLPIQAPYWSAYCLRGNRSWITWNGTNVLWLPPEYRPTCPMVNKQTIAMGCASGRVLLIEFDPDVRPTHSIF